MDVSLDKIAPPVAFVIVGCAMIIIGAVGVVPVGNPQPAITEPVLKTVLIVLGTLLVLVGPVLVWREATLSKPVSEQSSSEEQAHEQTKGGTKHGIKIVSPIQGKRFKGGYGDLTVEVSGTYKVMPQPGTVLRLFVRTDEPTSYWRHPAVIDFDEKGRKWYGKVSLWKEGGMRPYAAYIIAVVLNKAGEDTVLYAGKVQRETGKNISFDALPSCIEKCEDEILVFRE